MGSLRSFECWDQIQVVHSTSPHSTTTISQCCKLDALNVFGTVKLLSRAIHLTNVQAMMAFFR